MKIKNYKCRCGRDDFYLFTPENCIGENHVGIYCSYCGKWFKWADKDEKRLAIEKNLTMNCATKIRNDLIKNGDELIKRQDAIDACFNGKCANIYDCKEAIEKIPSAQKTGKWIIKSDTNPYYTTWWYECSECGQYPPIDRSGQEVLSNYCPNCGVRMECEKE